MPEQVNEKIHRLRKAKNLTQGKLGAMLGLSAQAVSKWERGETMPDIMLLPEICDIFEISIDSLLRNK